MYLYQSLKCFSQAKKHYEENYSIYCSKVNTYKNAVARFTNHLRCYFYSWHPRISGIAKEGGGGYFPSHHKLKKSIKSLPATDTHPKPLLCMATQYYHVHQSTHFLNYDNSTMMFFTLQAIPRVLSNIHLTNKNIRHI